MLTIDILTLFPGMFEGILGASILGRGQEAGVVSYHLHDIRNWTDDRHRTADDTPYGGGGGMVMKPEPVVAGIEHIRGLRGEAAGPVILLSPQGRRFDQPTAERLAGAAQFTLLCGRYEGIDERVFQGGWVDEEISIGDYVLTGGELPAMVVIDAVVRLLPGALGNEGSAANDSFTTGLLDHPHWTKPESFRGLAVPEVLRSGHHGNVERWRRREALRRTLERRPDLLESAALSDEDHRLLRELNAEHSEQGDTP